MSLLIAIKKILIFPVIFVERFIAPFASVVPDFSASVVSTALHERCSFGLCRPLHKCLSVIVEEVHGILVVLGVLVVPGVEVIMQVHF